MLKQPKNTKRLFIGFRFNELFDAPFNEILNRLKVRGFANITKRQNLHITLAFLGNIDLNEVEVVIEKLKVFPFKDYHPKFEFKELKVKTNNKKVMLWATFSPNGSAIKLHEAIHQYLNIKPDHKFVPHITFCRARKDQTVLNKNQFQDIKLIDYTPEKTTLYESNNTKKGAQYTPLLSIVNLA